LDYKTNPWVSFLRQYGPITQNDNMYDESIRRLTRRLDIKPLSFETPLQKTLVENFISDDPHSVILTGTAGDGKTYLCGQVWEAVGGDPKEWDSNSKIRRTKLPCGKKLVVVKDLSEVSSGRERNFLVEMCESARSADTKSIFLLAANDGQLVSGLKSVAGEKKAKEVADLIERMLVDGRESQEGLRLRLFNLSRTDVPELFDRILQALLSHSGWKGCEGCPGTSDAPEKRCPIWHNYQLLMNKELFRKRLRDLLTLCELNDLHLAIRQILIIVANTLLGHPEATGDLLNCDSAAAAVAAGTSHKASPYRNVFGANLTSRRRQDLQAFDALSRFGIGAETNNWIDNTLIYGSDDPRLASYFDLLVRGDPVYGYHQDFQRDQKAYLEADVDAGTPPILSELESQRQRLFFTMPEDKATELRRWELSLFRFGGEYLEEVYRPLLDGKKVPRPIVSRLVKGLNRIFTGLLLKVDRPLYIASASNNSQSKVSKLLTDTISVDLKKGEQVTVEFDSAHKRLFLCVYTAADVAPVRLALHPVRYEFLSRVAEGALPSSFSRECYEDFLAFKGRIHRAIEERRQRERSGPRPGEPVVLTILDVSGDGHIRERVLEIDAK